MSGSAVASLVGAELASPVDPRVAEMAAAIAAQHGAASRAVLFYGSCLRERNLDGLMLDFYLIVSDYHAAYGQRWLATANRLIPPNVFPFAFKTLSAKYAVLSEEDFARLCGNRADNVSVWARFAQPTRLVWAADEAARAGVVCAVAQAGPTLLSLALPGVDARHRKDGCALFEYGFSMTYKAELRAERKERSGSLVESAPAFYRALFDAACADGRIVPAAVPSPAETAETARRWRCLQRRGKWLSVVRLLKASFTFAGGIDYLAWKINRHAGTRIVIRPWQRRHPLVAAILLLPRLFASRAVG
ncbi:MAG: hypothetical protein KA533_08745 [Sphingobium sp.]|nr:hypothetical protein [Sphingobium sp.]MBP6112130.1 hypothetical protein [Sphingobium sp.]MBP8672119.1 hypothetical protein [Sphingobium sp.]MBP9158299.1 hypothetical protein [Sphingobium sp.]MCC6482900.1 hypothetical protein [Sphingomonadaceae bacterium]